MVLGSPEYKRSRKAPQTKKVEDTGNELCNYSTCGLLFYQLARILNH